MRVQVEHKRANSPPQPQLATGYVEAGSKLREVRAPHLANPTIKPRCYSGRGGGLYPWSNSKDGGAPNFGPATTDS